MTEVFGDIESRNAAASFENRIRLAEGPIDLTWQHASVTAEFLGDVYGMRCGAQKLNDNEARHSVGYLVNELLENAVKFRAPGDVLIESSLEGNRFEVRVANYISEETAQRFQPLLAEITEGDPGELLIARIEANAGDAFSSGSGLGLLTLMSDYGARLGWRFSRPTTGPLVFLEVFAALDLA